MSMSFESIEEATVRSKDEAEREADGSKKKKVHVGNFENMTWDKDGLKTEVTQYPDNKVVNWSALARTYNITNTNGNPAKNGGQIVKDYLKSVGVDTGRFKRAKNFDDSKECRIRRKKLRLQGGEIAVPTIETTAEIKDKLQKKLEEGVYTVGEQIVPRTYEKLIFKDGNIVKEQFIVEGRKQPLIDIREKLLSRQEKYMRNNNSYDD